jgi:PAS domain S-box-containing protein
MKEQLKILLLEDSAEDAEIVQRLLKKENLNCEFQVVMTREDYLQSLAQFQPDLILSDNTMPQFNATEALNIVRQQSLHIPFILVTGTVSEEFAAKIIKTGATDYVLKDRMARLPTAIDAALKQKKIEKEKLEAEKKVRESEEEYRTLVEQAADGIFIADMQGKFLAVNSSGCIMSQYSQEELLAMTIFDLTIPEDIQRNPFHINEMKQGKTVIIERVMRRKDGEVLDVETTGKILKDGRMLVFVRDITERKKAAEALAESENYLRTIVQTGPECIKLLGINGELKDMNPAGLAMIEADSIEQVKGALVLEIVNEPYKKPFEQLTKNVFEGKSGTLEFEITGLKGTCRWLETHAVPMKNTEGKIILLLGVTRDITERKKTAEALSNNELRFRTLTSNAPVGIFQTDAAGKTIYVNETWLEYTGLSFDEAMGDGWNTTLHPDDREAQLKQWEEKSKKGLESSSEFRLVDKKGKIRWVIGKATPLFNKNNQISGYIGTLSDISESKKSESEILSMNEQLRLLSERQQNIREEERTHIAREIHDELGQQLTVMKMDVSWLNKKLGANDEIVGKKTLELSKILDETVKTVRRIASELRPSLLDDLGLVAAIEWHLNEFEKRSGIKAELKKVRIEPLLPDAARTGLFRIVQESLTNVARHAKASKVTVSLQQKKELLVLKIEDDGVGFSKEKIAVKKTLGILGMKERTSVMGGTYEIVSVPGKGTTVCVTVPFNGETD